MHEIRIYIITIILFCVSLECFTQDKAIVTPELDSLLDKVDEDIKQEKFNEVTLVIDSLKQTSAYKKKRFDRLAIDLRYAQLLYNRNEKKKAIRIFLEGINQLKDYSNSKLTWMYRFIIGNVYRDNKMYEKALYQIDKAELNAKNRKDTLHLLRSYRLKGSTFFYMTELLSYSEEKYLSIRDSIMINYRKIIGFPISAKTRYDIGLAYGMLSTYESEIKNDLLAIQFVEKAIDIMLIDGSTRDLAVQMFKHGNVFYFKENYRDAIRKYKYCLKLLENLETRSLKIKHAVYQNISWSYGELEEYKLAYEYQEQATEYADSLIKFNQSKDIAAFESKYLESQRTEIEKNKRLRTQLYFLGFVLLTLIIGIIGYIIYNRLLNKQRITDRKISGLKYKALNAQMNPHFINNLLLCIHDLIDTNEKEMAIENLDRFNRLTNLVLRSTKSNLIVLSKEVEMLELYLDLQLLRFDSKFDYSVNMNGIGLENLNNIKIPPLILQPLVENSIVHGFKNMKGKGNLLIDFKIEDEDYLSCIITDNGSDTPNNLEPEIYSKNGISLKNIGERLALISDDRSDTKLILLSKIEGENEETAGHQIILKIPLIYA